jgi:hypothetical protein
MFHKLAVHLQASSSSHYTVHNEQSSLASTVTVDRGSNSSQKQLHFDAASASAATSTKKTVSFDLDLNEQYANEQLFKDQCYDLWFSGEEMKSFRKRTAKIAQSMIKSTKPCYVSYAKVMSTVYRACCKADDQNEQLLTPRESKYLIQCLDENMLGMDKWAIEAMAIHRSERRVVLSRKCMDLQDEHWEHAHFDEMLRAKSESISRASRLYASTIGLALAEDLRR